MSEHQADVPEDPAVLLALLRAERDPRPADWRRCRDNERRVREHVARKVNG